MAPPLIDAAGRLAELKEEIRGEARRAPAPTSAARSRPAMRVEPGELARVAGVAILKVIAIVLVPFVVLVRGSVWLYQSGRLPTWLALFVGALLTLGVVTAYASWLSRRLTGRPRLGVAAKWVAAPLVLFYCLYSLLYLSRVNAKTDDVRAYYTSIHPMLRLALSTWILTDGDLVVTDSRRVSEDYARMGLPINDATRHYRQADGWVHAADLRTIGRSRIKNWMMQLYFRAMGFRTLRHVGTEDHLHVQIRGR